MVFSLPSRHRRLAWGGLLAATTLLLLGALSPPFLAPEGRPFVMHVFSAVCHQLPARSPVFDGVQIAICDRCVGIYLGLVIGVGTVGWGRAVWQWMGRYGRYVFLASAVPMGSNWLGSILGVWETGGWSRTLTGLLFGIVAASFVAYSLLWPSDRHPGADTPTETERTGFA